MYNHHLPSRLATPKSSQALHVIAVISNPVRFKKRYELYEIFEKNMLGHDVNLVTVELAFGDREHFITQAGNPNHIQIRGKHEVWHKESMINIGLSRLPSDWKYVAWVDADVEFQRKDWVEQTKEALQHHQIVQPWSDCVDMGPDGQLVETHKSFVHQYVNHGLEAISNADSKGKYGYGKPSASKVASTLAFPHPGYAWAARREAIDGLGGLMDWPILGAADHHMAWAFVGKVMKSYPGNLHPNYLKKLEQFQARAELVVKRDIGFVPGTIMHHWHGKKKQRKYQERWEILQKWKFDPEVDVIKDSQGMWQLAGNKIGLRDDLRAYFRQRNEDSIDLE